MRALEPHLGTELAVAYLDVPRLSHAGFARPRMKVATWLSLLRGVTIETVPLLADGGRLVVHVDDEGAALGAAVLDDLLGRQSRTTVVWQKKYSPQNDLTGSVDDAQDYLFVYGDGEPRGEGLEKEWWSRNYAGKTEDATRETNQLLADGVIELESIPKTSKPQKLIGRLLRAFSLESDPILEVFSDTAFASAKAIAESRPAVLLSGSLPEEKRRMEECLIPRLEHGSRPDAVSTYAVESSHAESIQVSAKDDPIEYRAPSDDRRGTRLRSIRVEANGAADGDGRAASKAFPSMWLSDDVDATLQALEPAIGCDVTYARVDTVRAETDSQPASPGPLRGRLERVSRLLSDEGVVSLAVDPDRLPAARLVAETKVFGRDNYLGTLAVREGGDGSDWHLEPMFRLLPDARNGKIGLPKEREYKDDGDPRGPWRSPGHKGARGGNRNTAFNYRLPPYRWRLVDGELPPGAWRINPVSGVIWAPELREAGTYEFTVEVKDRQDGTSREACRIKVTDDGEPDTVQRVWWLEAEELAQDDAPPEIIDTDLPGGVVGRPYRAVLRARGGEPWDGTTAPGKPRPTDEKPWARSRYWEFSYDTLVELILTDDAYFGATGTARPAKKIHEKDETATTVVELSWWDRDRLDGEVPLERLVRMFTDPDDLILLNPGSKKGFGRVIESNRRCVAVCSSGSPPSTAPFRGTLGSVVARYDADGKVLRPNYDVAGFRVGLAWVLGFLPLHMREALVPADLSEEVRDRLVGITANGDAALVMLSPDEWPLVELGQTVSDELAPSFENVSILYYRGDPPGRMSGLSFRRIPFDLGGGR